MNNLNFSLMNSESAHGMFDADGSIVVYIREKLGVTGKSIGFQWHFEYEQAHFNQQNAIEIASFFGIEVAKKKRLTGRNADKTYTVFKTGINSQAGKDLIQIYKDKAPLLSARLKQFRVLQIYQNLKKVGKQQLREDIVMMLRLIHYISGEQRANRIAQYWTNRRKEFNFSAIDIKNGFDKAEKLIKEIEDEVQQLQASLPKTVLSNDYIRGFHYSDGSISTIYKQEKGCVSVIPHWSITTDDRFLLEAFKNTLGCGRIQKIGNCFQYLLQHRRNIKEKLVPIFENVKMLSQYKQDQWDNIVKAIRLMDEQRHFTPEGWRELINLTYAASYNNKRKREISYYLNVELRPKGKKTF